MSGWAFLPGRALATYRDGYRFGQLGYDLVEKRGLTRYQARTYLCVGALVMPWTKHPASGQDLVRRAFDAAYRAGDLAFAGYCFTTSIRAQPGGRSASRGSPGGSRKRPGFFPQGPTRSL